jgi:excisionase family DNA binding protein
MTPLMTVPEAANLLRISERTLRGYVANGRIPHRRIGGSIRFSEQDLESFVDSCVVEMRHPDPGPVLEKPLVDWKWIQPPPGLIRPHGSSARGERGRK